MEKYSLFLELGKEGKKEFAKWCEEEGLENSLKNKIRYCAKKGVKDAKKLLEKLESGDIDIKEIRAFDDDDLDLFEKGLGSLYTLSSNGEKLSFPEESGEKFAMMTAFIETFGNEIIKIGESVKMVMGLKEFKEQMEKFFGKGEKNND